jgi:hypothetical protein
VFDTPLVDSVHDWACGGPVDRERGDDDEVVEVLVVLVFLLVVSQHECRDEHGDEAVARN